MIPIYIVDASVVVKWFSDIKEQDRQQALWIRDRSLEDKIHLIAPDLIVYELANALRYNPSFEANETKKAIKAFLDFGIIIEFGEMLDKVVRDAIKIAYQFNITVYDSLYVALAKKYQCKLITANPKCHSRVKTKNIILLKYFKIK
ncbi:hypothetical protein A3F08_02030 [Candidatus Berkelbacteria bacterium RIFCSPHIGHO2_12_FULL_36_9]|uniref:PIN domain-containing protein n=1 Tax=Candidatus Berkelbacteria bacterium RIFCSPHIGHO2_12_FULL_36_9 TaxID=1797469 RepID=A0A1F5EF90_9BACT|nr:MAG: hypothetical protein A3F08_02030 [Candidatus Berkelbacteria bacterium RIFCSPHIGHO2_12_FULL_36_9]